MEAKKSPKANLENKKVVFLEIGFILALLLVFAAFEYRSYERLEFNPNVITGDIPIEVLIPVTVQKPKLPPVPPKIISQIKIVDDNNTFVEDVTFDPFMDENTEIEKWVPPMKKEEPVPEPVITIPDKNPEFPGGLGEMYQFLHDNIRYPQAAIDLGISGTVFVNFVVEKDGSITSVHVLRGIGGGCDEEAIRVVQQMHKWNPGFKDGKRVRVSFNIPVKFTLQ